MIFCTKMIFLADKWKTETRISVMMNSFLISSTVNLAMDFYCSLFLYCITSKKCHLYQHYGPLQSRWITLIDGTEQSKGKP